MGAPARPRVDFNFQRASPSNEQQLNAEKQAKEDIATRFTNIKFDKEDEEEKEIHPSRRARGTAAVPDKVDQHTLSPARHQLKEAGDGDGLDGKVLVKSQELTEEMRHLDLLARVTGDELEAQNQHAVKINMKVSVHSFWKVSCDDESPNRTNTSTAVAKPKWTWSMTYYCDGPISQSVS